MNWDAIGAIGELIGGSAVVLTLVYLSIQVRENTRVSKSEAFRDGAAIWNDLFKMLVDADSELIVNALKSYETLESHEKHQFDTLMIAMTSALESNLDALEGELVDDLVMEAVEEFVRRYFAYEGTFEWWRKGRRACAPSVQKWIDQRFTAPDPEYDYWGIRKSDG